MKQGDLLLTKVQKHVARQALAGAVLLLVGVMVLNVNHLRVEAGNNNEVSTNLVVTAGTLDLLNVDDNLNFSAADVGSASTENAVQDNVVVNDKSAGASLWSLYVLGNYMHGTSMNILAENITIVPSVATLYNISQFNNQSNAVGRGADGTNIAANVKLFNSIHNIPGVFKYNGLRYDVTVNATLAAGTYTGSLTLTLIDDAP